MKARLRLLMRKLARLLLFWPAALAIRLGRAVISVSDTAIGRFTVQPPLRLIASWVLYARSLPVVRPGKHDVLTPGTLEDLIKKQEEIAVMPCPCRAIAPECRHPLHGYHEPETCLSFGLVAIVQRMSGLSRKVTGEEAARICRGAVESGMVHHGIMSFGVLAEVCNCCVESCSVLSAYRHGIEMIVRPSGLMAVRTDACDGCRDREGRVCREICPYAVEPGADECVGCGLCAYHCPTKAIEMVSRPTGVLENAAG